MKDKGAGHQTAPDLNKKMKIKVVFLEISSFRGLSLGAIHFYGKLKCNHESIELKRMLTQTEVTAINKHERELGSSVRYRVCETSRGFETWNKVVAQGLRDWKKHFPDGDALILGDAGIADPQLVLDGDPKIKGKINAWYYAAKEIGWYEKDCKHMEEISDAFWKYYCAIAK